MKYEITSRLNSLSGAELTIRIPDGNLDQKALYTLQYDMPEFLVPFRYRGVDGQVELTYQVGERSKLRFFYGPKTPQEYVSFWEKLLRPLMECGDWFMRPFSFVLASEYLYLDKKGVINYLYIPAQQDCSDYEELKDMVAQLAKQNSVDNPELENVALRMLVQDFQPKNFLEALRKAQMPVNASAKVVDPLYQEVQVREKKESPQEPPVPEKKVEMPEPAPVLSDEIVIDISGGGEGKKKKGAFSFFGSKDGKRSKKKELKKEEEEDRTKKTPLIAKKPEGTGIEQKPWPGTPIYEPPMAVRPLAVGGDETQLEEQGVCLRLVGMAGLPTRIPVNIEVGGAFTIGRFDVTLGRRQSSFEFDAGTRAVSRHHAAIERDVDGYTITDLASKAGTFVDGTPLKPNMPYRLRQNMRIAFGTSGAEYMWQE